MGGFTWSHLFSPLRSIFRSKPDREIETIEEADHTYIRGHESQRSPCPFLNSLANHNYLPRDDKSITRAHLKAALLVAGNSSPLLADVLSSIVKPVTRKDGTFTLVDLRRHNAIEHDASFTRLDSRQGDNYTFIPAMFHAILQQDAKGAAITKETLARTRVRRDKEEKAAGHGAGVTFFSNPRLWVTMWSQTCILLQTFGDPISVEDITMFYEEERLPQWWLRERKEKRERMTFAGLLADIGAVFWKHLFVRVDEKDVKNQLKGW